ncbi:D-glycero-beta-D-manno-heptose 1,7-bisphosphate 7-phosphatase [Sulfurimonas sp. NW7]|uniref:D-glycero-beta-D-manno-heptose 1,7-bisphosphate 7-phosphatase n=1 Tax=Sulfurimonas sp. NW7 TaxID=2922727 RepID=UPI003DA9C30D
MTKALFLDRDGVINVEKNYVYKIEDFEFVDGIFDVCKHFQSQGYIIIVITNQAGIARGYYSEDDFHKLTRWMLEEFSKEGINISKVYHCPHHPEFTGECECRKPKPGMILEAQKEFDIDLSKSILVGDKESDIKSGINAGIGVNYLLSNQQKFLELTKSSCKIIKSISIIKETDQ